MYFYFFSIKFFFNLLQIFLYIEKNVSIEFIFGLQKNSTLIKRRKRFLVCVSTVFAGKSFAQFCIMTLCIGSIFSQKSNKIEKNSLCCIAWWPSKSLLILPFSVIHGKVRENIQAHLYKKKAKLNYINRQNINYFQSKIIESGIICLNIWFTYMKGRTLLCSIQVGSVVWNVNPFEIESLTWCNAGVNIKFIHSFKDNKIYVKY